jgi:hypothetical protein
MLVSLRSSILLPEPRLTFTDIPSLEGRHRIEIGLGMAAR